MSSPQENIRFLGARLPQTDRGLSWVMNVDDTDSPSDVIDALALQPFLCGDQPHSRSARVERVRPDAPLRPAGSALLRSVAGEGGGALLASGEGYTLRATRYQGGAAQVEVTAVTQELAEAVLAEAVRDAAEPVEDDEGQVEMGFWHAAANGPARRRRSISAPAWREIRGNYPSGAAAALDQVMALSADGLTGRLLLLHGPPGTGKTTALRALAREWAPWCQVDCVLDPERLFSDPGYLMNVAVGAEWDDDGERRWRLLLLEDCDELIRLEAKESTGQGLSRLLNLTDGMLGQGRHVLVAITTNERLASLHPAVVRPGRCLAQLEIGRLSRDEAAAWLERSGAALPPGARPAAEGATLAELAALASTSRQITTAPAAVAPATGCYL